MNHAGQQRTIKYWGIGFVVLGLVFQLATGTFEGPIVGIGLSVIGLALYAKAHGHHVAWSAMALVPFLGALFGLIALTPNAPTDTTAGSWRRRLLKSPLPWAILLVLTLVLIFVAMDLGLLR